MGGTSWPSRRDSKRLLLTPRACFSAFLREQQNECNREIPEGKGCSKTFKAPDILTGTFPLTLPCSLCRTPYVHYAPKSDDSDDTCPPRRWSRTSPVWMEINVIVVSPHTFWGGYEPDTVIRVYNDAGKKGVRNRRPVDPSFPALCRQGEL